MEPEPIVQPGAPILQQVQMPDPDPLEGTLNLPAQRSAFGGFSDIYRATWIRNGEEYIVCVKCLRINSADKPVDGLTKEQRLERRIKRETIVWRNMSHPNIYPYLGYQVVRGETWLVSPWTESGSLSVYLKQNQNLEYAAKLKLLNDAAQGLVYLHSQTQPIAHGDLSPGNVLIYILETVTMAALCDFGLSRIMTEDGDHTGLTTAGTTAWTIGFAAPELLTGTLPTPISDVYALAGVILFAMSGKKPFHNQRTAVTTILAIFRNEIPQPVDHPGLPETDPLWQFLALCWSSNPTNRPTAEDVIAQLNELIPTN